MQKFSEIHKQTLREAKLGRIWQNFTNQKYPVGIISAFREKGRDGKPLTLQQNVSRTKEMATAFRSAGFGYVYLDGVWKDPTTGITSTETSMLVSSTGSGLFPVMKAEAQKYDQYSFIYRGPESDWRIKEYGSQGNALNDLGDFHADKMNAAYSAIKNGSNMGRTFVFENVRPGPDWNGWQELAEAFPHRWPNDFFSALRG